MTPNVGDRVDEPHEGRALYITIGTVRRTDDNRLILLDPTLDRLVADASAGVHDSREQAREAAIAFMRREYPEDRGYTRHSARVYDVPDRLIREAYAIIEKGNR